MPLSAPAKGRKGKWCESLVLTLILIRSGLELPMMMFEFCGLKLDQRTGQVCSCFVFCSRFNLPTFLSANENITFNG